eukprot:CAMPEP_0172627264 /NCGR_PEP_ID=MMETSP1068-20121228/155303_1 /TAXON_ID=35684 /ORGANISM="Pseudopedinella elastica, Strain CCMP716" /LENGTH=137 /DNA_ID=CAMNT_0013437089 /DNA_START=140 /DNA_END=553 /DNA_ORIENTATION=+
MSGLLVHSGCAESTSCGATGVCQAYGRVMAWALSALAMCRLKVAIGTGVDTWMLGIGAHLAETAFWWGEYVLVTLPRLRALDNPWSRVRALIAVLVKPPYSLFHVVLLGPPLLAIWILLEYQEFVPKQKDAQKTKMK